MKNSVYSLEYIICIIFSLAVFSCADVEKSDIKPNDDIVVESPSTSDSPEETPSEETPEITECILDLSTVKEGETIAINCLLDLEEKTIMLPKNVTLSYDGGDIINGTLNFSNTGLIDGRLLNSSLKIDGDTQLINTEFEFTPSRWAITEGKVNDDVARRNRDILEENMVLIKELGASKFLIENMDAYFNVVEIKSNFRPSQGAISIPADFYLKMSDNTHIRMQPNNFKQPSLLGIFTANNVTIEGGNLYGDRDEHDYSSGGTHEWGHCVNIDGSKNVIIKNITITDAAGDGVNIHDFGHTFDPHYTFSEDVLVTGNKIIRARRNGISITGGKELIIEENELIDSGTSTDKSIGTAPQWAIDIEPVWSNGTKFEIVENVIIRNNTERGSEKGGFINARGHYITYEGNLMESTIAIGETIGSIVRNNTFKNPTKNSKTAILAGMNDPRGHGNERNSDNQVYGNTIIGFDKGIFLQDPEIDLHSNTITNCKSGIQILNSRDSKIRNNTITSNRERSEGIANKVSEYIDNVTITENTIKVVGSPFRFTSVNLEDPQKDFRITIENNDATSTGNNISSFNKIRGFFFKNNLCHNSGIRTVRASSGYISNNTFENGIIIISEGSTDISFTDNIVTGGKCFNENSTDVSNIIKSNNTCDI